MTFAGADYSYLPYFEAAGIMPTGGRIYLNTTSNLPGPVPASWPMPGVSLPKFTLPGRSEVVPYRFAVSIRPDVAKVCAGELDDQLRNFLASAPGGPCSLLSLWHEAGNLDYPGLDAGTLKGAQIHIQKLCRENNYNVKVGHIAVSNTVDLGVWAARNLDYYAMDVYDNATGTLDPNRVCTDFARKANARVTNGNAVIAVTETNSRITGERRATWLRGVWNWMQTNGYTGDNTCFLTYWNPAGPQSGAWDATDKPTLDALRTICAQSAELS